MFTVSEIIARLTAEQEKLAKSTFATPPAGPDRLEKLDKLFGQYQGLENAKAAVADMGRKARENEDDDADNSGQPSRKPRFA